MVSLDILERRGSSAEKIRPILEEHGSGTGAGAALINYYKHKDSHDLTIAEKIGRLRNRMRLRIQGGRENNILTHKLYHALDLAWDIPFRQISPTLLGSLIDKDASTDEVLNKLNAWGFNVSEVITETEDPKTGKKIKRIDVPAFFHIFVPLVRAYVTIRWAKLTNDRRLQPFFKFDPGVNNERTRMQAEIITHRIEVMSRQMGYFNVIKQAVFQMLHYSRALIFPVEEWFSEEQEYINEDKKIGIQVVREGIRYHLPHPTRTFIDENHRPSTYNTNTGCEYGGYWRVLRYKDVRDQPDFFNIDKISIGATDWWNSANVFFNTVYNVCTIKTPTTASAVPRDRETKMAEQYYSQAHEDQSVLITEYYEKLIPKENGLGDYEHPVWFRFVVASDDTIIYGAPLPYNPIIYMGYDADEQRSQNASLSLEILPFQDQISNLMTQYLLTIRQNLTNVTFVDEDVLQATEGGGLKVIQNLGEKLWRKVNFLKYSGRKAKVAKHDIPNAFYSHRFPNMNSQEILQGVNTILNILERILVMSAQEVGSAASHEQTAEEIRNVSASTSTRLMATGIPIDEASEAMKLQLYQALMAYGQDEFYAQVPHDSRITKETLEKYGFTWDERNDPNTREKQITVKVKKGAIWMESFTSKRDVYDRVNNVQIAAALANSFGQWLGNPMLSTAVGADQALEVINLIARLAGFPREFKLENKGEMPPEQMQQQLAQFAKQLSDAILNQVKEGLTPVIENQKQMGETLQELGRIVESLMAAGQAPAPVPPTEYDRPYIPPLPQGEGEPVAPMAPPPGITIV